MSKVTETDERAGDWRRPSPPRSSRGPRSWSYGRARLRFAGARFDGPQGAAVVMRAVRGACQRTGYVDNQEAFE